MKRIYYFGISCQITVAEEGIYFTMGELHLIPSEYVKKKDMPKHPDKKTMQTSTTH